MIVVDFSVWLDYFLRVGPGGPTRLWRAAPHGTAKTLPLLVDSCADWLSKISGQGSVSLTSPELAYVALLFITYVAWSHKWTWPPAGVCPLSEGLWKTGIFVSLRSSGPVRWLHS